jgi:F1F0 ATPase subunit 2
LGVRTATTLAGFYLVSQGDWRNCVACLLGFLAARAGITRLMSPNTASAL